MGGSSSKTAIKTLSQQIINVSESVISTCTVISQQKQNIDISNTGVQFGDSTSINQTTDIRNECFSSTKIQNSLQNAIINTIAQSSSAEGVSFISAFGASRSESIANITNIIKSGVTMRNIQNTYNMMRQAQKINVENSGFSLFSSLDISQGSRVFAAATLDEVNKTGILNTISQHIDQQSIAKTQNPLQIFADLFTSFRDYIFLIILSFVFIFILLRFYRNAS